MPTTTVTYVVRSPIHGYNGNGYEHLDHLETEFTDENPARERLARCNSAWEIYQLDTVDDAQYETGFMNTMTDGHSFHFRGPSTLLRRTVTEEQIA